MFKKALVPLDGSRAAEAILPYISYLAKGFDMPIRLMTAIDPQGFDETAGLRTPQVPGKMRVPINPELKAKTYLEGITNRLAKDGLKAELEVAVGRPAEEIVRVAERQGCHLIVLSAHSDESLSGHGILGSVTTKILYYSHIPTLIVPPSKAAKYAEKGARALRVIVPLDGSSFGETALPYAQELAQRLSLEIVLVRAIGDKAVVGMADPSSGLFVVDLQEAASQGATEYLKRLTDDLGHEGLKVDSQLLKGAPARSIVEIAAGRPQSMIVMTSHGQSAVARWLIGSVTETVVRTTDDPVLVIPRQYGRRYAVEVTDILGRTPLFSNLRESDLESIAQAARVRSYQPGDVIVKEGESTGGFFIITSGKVEVVKGISVLATLGPGEFFGEMSVIDEQPRSATVRALEASECVTIRRSDFLAELERHPQIAVRMLPEFVRRLREAQNAPTQ